MSDYSDIQQELDDFENAVYGEEVRDSMISAIKKIHDTAKSAAGAPDASSATAGQAPIADGAGGWQWGDVESGDTVPTEVRQAIFTLLNNAVYRDTDLQDEKVIIQSWATEITAISVSPTTLRINGMSQETIVATTQPSGGIVSWSSSDESIATVSGGVVTPTGVNGTCTITASCGGKSATCAVTVSGFATLLSISAVYTQSGTVYDTDTLDSLRSDLVVTGTYDDSRTLPITGYVLSGTLTEGTSTITVSYGGKTTTFTVMVTEVPMLQFIDGAVSSSVQNTTITTRDGTTYNVAVNPDYTGTNNFQNCRVYLQYDFESGKTYLINLHSDKPYYLYETSSSETVNNAGTLNGTQHQGGDTVTFTATMNATQIRIGFNKAPAVLSNPSVEEVIG